MKLAGPLAEAGVGVPLVRGDIQALRGLAVTMVVLFHAGALLAGGFVGVDVFFVVSGFVIGQRIVGELQSSGRLSALEFYRRRVRRLLPALTLMVVVVVIAAPFMAPVSAVQRTLRTAAAAELSLANFYLARSGSGGYFASAAETNPLLHTWSLSVEEQFYLVLVPLLLAAWAAGRRLGGRDLRALRFAVGIGFAASLAMCLVRSGGADSSAHFYLPVTRAWEFLAGVAVALVPVRRRPEGLAGRWLAAFGWLLILAAGIMQSSAVGYPGIATVVPVAGAVLVVARRATPGRTSGPDAARPLVWLGDRSYSWYLWHWPFIVFTAAMWPGSGPLLLLAAGLAAIVPAALSYQLVENRYRAASSVLSRPALGLGVVCVAAALLITAGASRVGPVGGAVREFQASQTPHLDDLHGCKVDLPFGDPMRPAACVLGPASAEGSLVLIGDSNAGHFAEAVDPTGTGNAGPQVQIVTMSSCPLVDVVLHAVADESFDSAACRRFVQTSVDRLVADPPDVILIGAASDRYLDPAQFRIQDPLSDMTADQGDAAEILSDGMHRVLTRLRGSGSRVVVLGAVPTPVDWNADRCSALAFTLRPDACRPQPFETAVDRSTTPAGAAERSATTAAGVELWDMASLVCLGGICHPVRNGHLVWRDGGHISVATAESLSTEIQRRLASPRAS